MSWDGVVGESSLCECCIILNLSVPKYGGVQCLAFVDLQRVSYSDLEYSEALLPLSVNVSDETVPAELTEQGETELADGLEP
jgi:hypothetical protein